MRRLIKRMADSTKEREKKDATAADERGGPNGPLPACGAGVQPRHRGSPPAVRPTRQVRYSRGRRLGGNSRGEGMADTELSDFIDGVYEASVVPELWPQVLRVFAVLADADEGVLMSFRGVDSQIVCSSQAFAALASQHYSYDGAVERSQRLIALKHPGFAADADVFTDDEIRATPVYADFLIPRGYGSGIATSIHVPSGDNIIFHCERAYARGSYDPEIVARLDALRPHLARAALWSSRLGLQQAQAAAAALELVGLPAAVLGRRGQAIAANGLLAGMMPRVVQDLPSRLALVHQGADALLKAALETIARHADDGRTRSIPIPADGEDPPAIVHLVPIRGAAHDIFAGATAVLVATPVLPQAAPGVTVLQGLFDLTPAEAKVAGAIARGDTTAAIAATSGTSPATIRNQVAAVLAKTGLSRQAELVGLLAGRALGGGPS